MVPQEFARLGDASPFPDRSALLVRRHRCGGCLRHPGAVRALEHGEAASGMSHTAGSLDPWLSEPYLTLRGGWRSASGDRSAPPWWTALPHPPHRQASAPSSWHSAQGNLSTELPFLFPCPRHLPAFPTCIFPWCNLTFNFP